MSRVTPDFYSGSRWAIPLWSPNRHTDSSVMNEKMESLRAGLRDRLGLTASGPRSCPLHSASPEPPSTPQTGRRKAASVGCFWGSPGGWRKGTGGLFVLYKVWHLYLDFVPSHGTYAHPAIGCAPSFLHFIHLGEISLLSCLTVRSPSKGPPDSGLWTWLWDNPSAFLLKIWEKLNASLSVGIRDHRNTEFI